MIIEIEHKLFLTDKGEILGQQEDIEQEIVKCKQQLKEDLRKLKGKSISCNMILLR